MKPHSLRIAIVGGGLTGTSLAWALSRIAESLKKRFSITILDMGRTLGGRATSRSTRKVSWLNINHGCPHFLIEDQYGLHPNAEFLLQNLQARRHIRQVQHLNYRRVNSSGPDVLVSSQIYPSENTKVQNTQDPLQDALVDTMEKESSIPRLLTGFPHMGVIAPEILKLAQNSQLDINTQLGTRIDEFIWDSDRRVWVLSDSNGEWKGEFDWLVITSASLLSKRWKNNYEAESPVLAVLEKYPETKSFAFASQMESGFKASPVIVLMVTLPLMHLEMKNFEYDFLIVEGDDVLHKVSYQYNESKDAITFVAHSSREFAEKHKNATGISSGINKYRKHNEKESNIALAEFYSYFKQFMKRIYGADQSLLFTNPVYGPEIHRWGAAFPDTLASQYTNGESHFIDPELHFACSGDFFSHPLGSVQSALNSSQTLGDALSDYI